MHQCERHLGSRSDAVTEVHLSSFLFAVKQHTVDNSLAAASPDSRWPCFLNESKGRVKFMTYTIWVLYHHRCCPCNDAITAVHCTRPYLCTANWAVSRERNCVSWTMMLQWTMDESHKLQKYQLLQDVWSGTEAVVLTISNKPLSGPLFYKHTTRCL